MIVTNNMIIHHADFTAQCDAEHQHYEDREYFKAGNSAASAIRILIDPDTQSVAPAPFGGLTPVYAAELVASFFGEIVHLNHLDSLQGCAVDSKDVVDEVYKAIMAVVGHNEDSAFAHVVMAAVNMASAVQDCKAAPEDVKAIGWWLMRRAGSK